MVDKILVWFEELQDTRLGRLSLVLIALAYLTIGAVVCLNVGGIDDSAPMFIFFILGMVLTAGLTIIVAAAVGFVYHIIDWVLNGY